MTSDRRTTIAVTKSLAKDLSELAKTVKIARYAFACKCLDTAVRICREDGKLEEIYPAWKVIQLSKEASAFPLLPRALLSKMVKRLFREDKEWLLKSWYEEGTILGRIFKLHFHNISEVGVILPAFPSSSRRLEATAIDLDGQKGYRVSIIGDFCAELAVCLGHFIRGTLSVYSFTAVEHSESENMVEMVVKKTGSD